MAKQQVEQITIPEPNIKRALIPIKGTAPLCIHAFSQKARRMMLEAQTSTAKKKKKDPRNIQEDFENAKHVSDDGWCGVPAAAFRAAMISACRLVGFQMTKAKLSIFVEADGLDRDSHQPLVRIIADGEPEMSEMCVRLESGVASVAIRPLWQEWGCLVCVKWDADQFTLTDVVNLLDRAGQQVGIGEGRPDSKKSTGLGWGTFEVDREAMNKIASNKKNGRR